MTSAGVHYLAKAKILERLEQNAQEYEQASIQLQEALALGDLKENSEYDAAKLSMSKITKERDMLTPVLTMPVLKSSDSVVTFEEGCVIDLKVYATIDRPLDPRSSDFQNIVNNTQPLFYGKVMLGGTLPIQELLEDSALSVDTAVGGYLLGKPSGAYSIRVPGGFAPVVAMKLRSNQFTPEDIKCTFNG